jgi:hypothetical protein
MLEHKQVAYEHISEFPALAGVCSAFGAQGTDTFAPPMIIDGEFKISQSTACCQYVGEKCGFTVPNSAKVRQKNTYYSSAFSLTMIHVDRLHNTWLTLLTFSS